MELARLRAVATVITFPIIDADGDVVTGAAGLDSEITSWADGSTPGAFADCTNEATEIGTSGVYHLSVTLAEMTADYIYIRVQTSTAGAKTQHILINTLQARGDASGRVDVGSWIGNAVTAGVGNRPAVDAEAISGSVAAADNVEANITNLDATVSSRATPAQVNTEVDTALADIHLDHLLAVDYDPATPPGVATALLNELIESDAGVSRFTANAVEQVWSVATRILTANTNFNDPTAAAIADAVMDEPLAGHTTLATVGQVLNALGSRTGAVNDVAPAAGDFDVDGFTEATNDHFNGMKMVFTTGVLTGQSNIITDYIGASQNCVFADPWTEAPADNDQFVLVPCGKADIRLWRELLVNVLIAGRVDANAQVVGDKTGYALTAADKDDIVDRNWDELRSAHVIAGSFGEGVASVQGNVTGSVGSVTGAVGSVTAAVTVGTINTDVIDATAVATVAWEEAADVLLGRSIQGGANGGRDVTSALRRVRNRIAIVAGTMTVYTENDTTSAWTAAVTTTAGDPISEIDPA